MSISYWDPTGSIDYDLIRKSNEGVKRRSDFVLNKFGILRVIFWSLLIIGSGVFFYLFSLGTFDELSLFFYYCFFLLFVFGSSYGYLSKIKRSLIKQKVAEENNWLYKPGEDMLLHRKYFDLFPKIFNLGNGTKNFEDVFWGNFEKDGKVYSFVLGNFNYIQVTSSGKRTRRTKYTDHFFMVRLDGSLNSTFSLLPKNVLTKFANLFTKRDIVTESYDFNNKFSFYYGKGGSEVQVDIMSVLSPRVLEELVSFSDLKSRKFRSLGGFRVFFEKNCLIFSCPGPLFRKVKAGLSKKSLEYSEEDAKLLRDEVSFFFDVGDNILKYVKTH